MKRILFIVLAIISIMPLFAQTLEWHIKDNYTEIKYLGNDLFKVKDTKGKWGVVNEYGEMTIEALYDSITPIVENRALLLDNTGIYLQGIIDEKGKLFKSFYNGERIAHFPYFSEGMLACGFQSGKFYSFGYLDIYGNIRVEPKYYWAAPFNGGKAVVQYKSGNFGIINTSGGIALKDNRKIKFMSTQVDNQLLIAVSSTRGDKIILANLKPNGKLEDVVDLESGTVVNGTVDYKSLSCKTNGHVYYFDDAMRLLSSSTGKTFNEPLSIQTTQQANTSFRKKQEANGWGILYEGKLLLQSSFRDITFCDNEYAIVKTQRNNVGVLKLNQLGNINIQNVSSQVEFYHHEEAKSNIEININGLLTSSLVEIGITGLKDQEEKYSIPSGHSGVYRQPISYFIPSTSLGSQVTLPVEVKLYIDGMLYKVVKQTLTGVHQRGFRVSEANAPQYSNVDGKATITFSVQSLVSKPSASAKVIVSGDVNDVRKFNGAQTVNFDIPVIVPNDGQKTYSFTVTVKEEGCPSYTRTISKTISHYFLQ